MNGELVPWVVKPKQVQIEKPHRPSCNASVMATEIFFLHFSLTKALLTSVCCDLTLRKTWLRVCLDWTCRKWILRLNQVDLFFRKLFFFSYTNNGFYDFLVHTHHCYLLMLDSHFFPSLSQVSLLPSDRPPSVFMPLLCTCLHECIREISFSLFSIAIITIIFFDKISLGS